MIVIIQVNDPKITSGPCQRSVNEVERDETLWDELDRAQGEGISSKQALRTCDTCGRSQKTVGERARVRVPHLQLVERPRQHFL